MIRKVQLINAPIDGGSSTSGNTGCFPHLGILSIATYLRKIYPELEIEAIDGSIVPLETILERVDADFVGISVLATTYASALAIAKIAKERGAFVVFGNDHASTRGEIILRNRPDVDGVVYGDYGEIPSAMIISYLNGKCAREDVPNLMSRGADGKIKTSAPKTYSLDSIPVINRKFLEYPEVYQNNYRSLYGSWHSNAVVATNTNFARGCGWGDSDARRCLYCDIYDLSMRSTSAARVWSEIEYLNNESGCNFIYEVCDSFTSFALPEQSSYIDQLVAARPHGNKTAWFVYGRAEEITPSVADKLAALNVLRVNIGIDSGDRTMLRTLRKGNKDGEITNLRAVELLGARGMQVYASIVLGSLGESEETLRATLDHVRTLVQVGNIVAVTCSVLLPLPGAPAWRVMMDRAFAKKMALPARFVPRCDVDFAAKYGDKDLLETDLLARDWAHCFCQVDYSTIKDYALEIRQVASQSGAFSGGFGVRDF